jgi:4-hydroxybenzoate polyprenyltransferase
MTVSKIIRASEWWEYKLPPMLAVVYATILYTGKSLLELAPRFCILLLGIVIGAVYVSLVNDLTDIREDQASGKVNRLSRFPFWLRICLTILPVFGGFFFAFVFLNDALSVALYALCWIAFSLYSVPPFRLKKRGVLGVFADAAGAHLFPTLFLLSAMTNYLDIPMDWYWFSVVAVWSLMYGLRGILWHQFFDRENDIASGVNTFASKKDPSHFYKEAALVMSIELIALAFMLTHLFKPFPVVALLFYVVLLLGYSRIFGLRVIAIVPPQNRPWHFSMSNYYQLLFPLSLIITSSFVYPQDWFLLAAQLLLFPFIAKNTCTDVISLLRLSVKRWII